MKTLNKLKLNELQFNEMTSRELKEIKGGDRHCSCSCYWAGSEGGSSVRDNCSANFYVGSQGGTSEYGDEKCYAN